MDFPLCIFPTLTASTKRDPSCARQGPDSVWVWIKKLSKWLGQLVFVVHILGIIDRHRGNYPCTQESIKKIHKEWCEI